MWSILSSSQPPPPQPGWKVLELINTKSGTSAYAKDSTGKTVYHLQSQMIKATFHHTGAAGKKRDAQRADFAMHLGDSKAAPIIGGSRTDSLATKLEICFSDPKSESAEWQKVENFGQFTNHCMWTEPKTGKKYSWKQTGRQEVKEKGGHTWDDANLKLVDEETGEIVAWFISYISLNRLGKFEFKEDPELGVDWERAVVLTGMALYIKEQGVGVVSSAIDLGMMIAGFVI